jgi:Chaperone of endosialidase
MNRLIQLNKATAVFLVVLGLGCFCLSPTAQAQACSTRCISNNAGFGQQALSNVTTGDQNTATGAGALLRNTTGSNNTATGFQALAGNTTGFNNTANGWNALNFNNGMNNTATGFGALQANTTGDANTANGYKALNLNNGTSNTAIGAAALQNNTTGNYNMASGFFALQRNTTGEFNTAIGAGALLFNTADENTATGAAVLLSNTTGGFNTAAGSAALFNNTTGAHNTGNGFQTLSNNTTGSDNVALGFLAGNNQTTGGNNVYIGSNILGVAGENDACYIASIFGQTSADGIPVLINSNNKLGTATSSARFKRDIHDMDKASEALFALRPVAFRYKEEIDPAGTSEFGLVAEDVEKVNPDLVVRDKGGKPYTVRYDQVNAMLLNEFLKEHRKMQEQEARLTKQEAFIARQQQQIEVLTAGLQKVSAQVEVSKSAPQTVLNNQ